MYKKIKLEGYCLVDLRQKQGLRKFLFLDLQVLCFPEKQSIQYINCRINVNLLTLTSGNKQSGFCILRIAK